MWTWWNAVVSVGCTEWHFAVTGATKYCALHNVGFMLYEPVDRGVKVVETGKKHSKLRIRLSRA